MKNENEKYLTKLNRSDGKKSRLSEDDDKNTTNPILNIVINDNYFEQ